MATTARERRLELKAANEAIKAERAAQEAELLEAQTWAIGAKDSKKQKEAEDREAEKQRKAKEKADLLAAEEAGLSGIKRVGKPAKKKGPDDFKFLQAALASQPKTKAQLAQEERQKQEAERRKKEDEARIAREEREKKAEEERKRNLARGIVDNSDELMIPVNNRGLEDDFDHGTGLDAALDVLTFSSESASSSKKDRISSREYQALYKAFHERMLPIVKDENPGLRHTQYDEKIMKLWKRSPENPMS